MESHSHALAVGFPNSMVTAYERGQGNGFGSRKRCIPTRSMLHGSDSFSIRILVFVNQAMPDKLFAGLRVLAQAEFGECVFSDHTTQAILRCQTTLPFALYSVASRPVALLLRSEFLFVIALCLTRRKGLGNS